MSKIMFVIPTLSKGGAERVVSLLSCNLPITEKKVVIFDGSSIDYPVCGELENFKTRASFSILKKFVNFTKRYFLLKKLKNEYKPLYSISFLEPANLLNIITKRKEKVIISFRNHYSSSFKKEPFWGSGLKRKIIVASYKFLVRNFYKYADVIVAVSQEVKKDLIENFNIPENKTKVIYNPYPVEEIRKQSQESLEKYEKLFKKHKVLITVGRLTTQKAQWYLLRIFKQLLKNYQNLKLVILGEGELKDYLVELSKGLGLKTYVWDKDEFNENYDVYFLGFQENPFKFIANSYLFVFPSLWEGFPNALVEALACGKLVVSADCYSGSREILAPNTPFDFHTKKPEFAKYGILMPTFNGKIKSANEPLTEEESIWFETLQKLLNETSILKNYEAVAIQRAYDFHINKVIDEWRKLIKDV